MNDLFGQLWKEYSLSDSRYQTQNAFVLCMETITAVCWGPLSFLLAYFITVNHPLRHPFQALVSTGQLYGDVLYYATSLFDFYILGLEYSRPEPAIFWGYFVLMNAFWIVFPGSKYLHRGYTFCILTNTIQSYCTVVSRRLERRLRHWLENKRLRHQTVRLRRGYRRVPIILVIPWGMALSCKL